MTEFELKLEIPANRLDAVKVAIGAAAKPSTVHLRAIYLDTADSALAGAGIALRLRQEGKQWVQTAKASGRGPVERLEHNAALAHKGAGAPEHDLARHDGTPVGKRLRAALTHAADASAPVLHAVFETDIERTLVEVREGDSTLEIALDQGRILAEGRTQEIRELEIELKEGQPLDAIQLARQWAARHGLWLSTVSKAQRGHQLARGELSGPPVTAPPVGYAASASSGEVVAAVLDSCLRQVIGNASEIAGGNHGDDYVHQVRVGIRRLRTALRELQALQPLDASAEPTLVEVFRTLGEHRDRIHVRRTVEPRLEAAGGPAMQPMAQGDELPDPGAMVRTPAFQDALLGLLAQQMEAESAHGRPRKRLARALDKLWRQVIRDGDRYARLDEVRQHRVRKRLKRLRYLAEFAAPLFPGRRVRRLLDDIKPVQDALGLYNDELMAARLWRGFVDSDARAWFGVGWLSARHEVEARACQKALRRLAARPTFWD